MSSKNWMFTDPDDMDAVITAATEYAKDPKLRPEDIITFRDWLWKQPHLPQGVTDEYLLAILHSSEYSVERAKKLLVANVTCRTNYPELFANRDPLAKDKQAVWGFVDFWISPHVTKEKYRVFYGGLHHYDATNFDFPALLNVFASVLDTTIREQGVCPGYVAVLDCNHFTLSHLAKTNITHIRNVLHYVQEAILVKIKEIHVINVSLIIDKIMFIVKPFLKKKLLDMLYFHNIEDMDEFYEAVPRNLLPDRIGGTLGDRVEFVYTTRKRVESMREWLIEEEKHLRIDKRKQPMGNKDVYSVPGSFRRLELD